MKEFLFVSLIVAMLLFGCAGNQQVQQPKAQPQPTGGAAAQAQGGAGTETPPAPPAPATGGSGTGTQSSGALDDFTRLIGLKSTAQWKAAYSFTTILAGASTSSEMTQYIKGATKLRTDLSASGQQIRTYVLSGIVYVCSSEGGSSWSCMKVNSPTDDKSTQSKDDVEKNPSKYAIVADGTMQIAGATATCFKTTVEGTGDMRECISAEGVPLYYRIVGVSEGKAMEYEMKATSYTTSVSDSDFQLPAAPTELTVPSGGSSGGAGGNACSYCSYLTGSQKDECLSSCGG